MRAGWRGLALGLAMWPVRYAPLGGGQAAAVALLTHLERTALAFWGAPKGAIRLRWPLEAKCLACTVCRPGSTRLLQRAAAIFACRLQELTASQPTAQQVCGHRMFAGRAGVGNGASQAMGTWLTPALTA